MSGITIAQHNILNRANNGHGKADQLINLLEQHNVQIACLQEIPYGQQHTFGKTFRKHGWEIVFANNSERRTDGSALAWKRDSMEQDRFAIRPAKIDAVAQKFSHHLLVCSYHGHWGGRGQVKRLEEVRRLVGLLKARNGKNDTTLLCGDFNAEQGEAAIRLLKGELADGQEYWTEAQDTAILLKGSGAPSPTVLSGSTPLGGETARLVGLQPEYVPARRIDYMFSRGWNYDKPNGWTGDVEMVDTGFSDHLMMVAHTIG